jgi:glycerol-3-phosphate dehydrogenase
VKLKERQKKDFTIISKTYFAYLQNYIIESAVFVAGKDADTVLLSLSIKELEKILKKIRISEKKDLYLSIIKGIKK